MTILIGNELLNYNLVRSVFFRNNYIVFCYSQYNSNPSDTLRIDFGTKENAKRNFNILMGAFIANKSFVELFLKEGKE